MSSTSSAASATAASSTYGTGYFPLAATAAGNSNLDQYNSEELNYVVSVRIKLAEFGLQYAEIPKLKGRPWFVIKDTTNTHKKIMEFLSTPLTLFPRIEKQPASESGAPQQAILRLGMSPSQITGGGSQLVEMFTPFNGFLLAFENFLNLFKITPEPILFGSLLFGTKNNDNMKSLILNALEKLFHRPTGVLTKEIITSMFRDAIFTYLVHANDDVISFNFKMNKEIVKEFLREMLRKELDRIDPDGFINRDILERFFRKECSPKDVQTACVDKVPFIHASLQIRLTDSDSVAACPLRTLTLPENQFDDVLKYMRQVAEKELKEKEPATVAVATNSAANTAAQTAAPAASAAIAASKATSK